MHWSASAMIWFIKMMLALLFAAFACNPAEGSVAVHASKVRKPPPMAPNQGVHVFV